MVLRFEMGGVGFSEAGFLRKRYLQCFHSVVHVFSSHSRSAASVHRNEFCVRIAT